jgi:hypothetical protein
MPGDSPGHVPLRQYIEYRFDVLEQRIDDKLNPLLETNREVDGRLCYLERTRIPAVETRCDNVAKKAFYIAGAVSVITAIMLGIV